MASKDAKKGEKKEDITAYGKLRHIYTDVDSERQAFVLEATANALKEFQKGDFKYYWQVAESIKKECDAQWPGRWHVIVGKEFGTFCTHETAR